MKIAYVVPGSGDNFYCQNCIRDQELIKGLMAAGHQVLVIPMYLPLLGDAAVIAAGAPVFYGAINVYLEQRLPLLAHMPDWVHRLLDAPLLLRWAAQKADATRASGLEELTLSILAGENGRQARELEQLTQWLRHEQPDIVHLSNALLAGLAAKIKRELQVPVICSLQDEDHWVDAMQPHYIPKVWEAMRQQATAIDDFIAVSHYYRQRMLAQLALPEARMHVVHIGIAADSFPLTLRPDTPTIGFLGRIAPTSGLETLTHNYLRLKQQLPDLKLVIAGGYTADDKPFVRAMQRLLVKNGVGGDSEFITDFSHKARSEFWRKLSLLSVPMPQGEAFGLYQLEAFASGVPVVQPNIAAFPELIEISGGGIVYDASDADALFNAMAKVLLDQQHGDQLASRGRESVIRYFNSERMVREIIAVYQQRLGQ